MRWRWGRRFMVIHMGEAKMCDAKCASAPRVAGLASRSSGGWRVLTLYRACMPPTANFGLIMHATPWRERHWRDHTHTRCE